MLNDDELEEIRRRKIQLMMERAAKPKVQEPMADGSVKLLTDATFWHTLQQTKTALVDFFGEWCQPCKMLTPILGALASDYVGKVFFAKIDIDRNPRATAQFGVQSVPMVIGFKNGKPVGKIPGLRTYDDYDTVIERLLQN
ncbi:MAG: thioredoxin domain-containing protein [Candidatus Thorarchaeota archaeon]|jgi:thioredoxin 1